MGPPNKSNLPHLILYAPVDPKWRALQNRRVIGSCLLFVLAAATLILGVEMLLQSVKMISRPAGSPAEIALAEAGAKQKQLALQRKAQLYGELIALGKSSMELDEARASVEIESLRVQYLKSPPSLTSQERNAIIGQSVLAGSCFPIAGILVVIAIRVLLNRRRMTHVIPSNPISPT